MEKSTKAQSLMRMDDVHGIFLDAMLLDEADQLVFASIWGRDTSIRELQARLTLGSTEGGLTSFKVIRNNDIDPDKVIKKLVNVGSVDQLEQSTGRVRVKVAGEMVHLWLYRRDIIKPDVANQRAILLSREGHPTKEQIWNMVMAICPIPLLSEWRDALMPDLTREQMIKPLAGTNVNGCRVVIDEERLAEIVKQGCREQRLTIRRVMS